MKKVFLFNGRSVEGILSDVRREFPDHSPCVIVLLNDAIPSPEGVKTMTVDEAVSALSNGDDHEEIVLVANGGVTRQLVPIVIQLVKGWQGFQGPYRLVELQRGECPRVFHERNDSLGWEDKPAYLLNEEEAQRTYTQRSW